MIVVQYVAVIVVLHILNCYTITANCYNSLIYQWYIAWCYMACCHVMLCNYFFVLLRGGLKWGRSDVWYIACYKTYLVYWGWLTLGLLDVFYIAHYVTWHVNYVAIHCYATVLCDISFWAGWSGAGPAGVIWYIAHFITDLVYWGWLKWGWLHVCWLFQHTSSWTYVKFYSMAAAPVASYNDVMYHGTNVI